MSKFDAAPAAPSAPVPPSGGHNVGHRPVAGMQEVSIEPCSLPRLAELLPPGRAEALLETADRARALLAGRTVWNINSTAQGGGVAEMLQALLAYGRGAGIDTRWLVLAGDPEFFAITKRVHNMLHGSPGDGGDLGAVQRAHYLATSRSNASAACAAVQPGDIVLLHDPQTAGMASALREHGAHVVWRCHIGSDSDNAMTAAGWEFLREFIEPADAFVFSRADYAPPWLSAAKVWVIAPSIDPFSPKNAPLGPVDVAATLRRAGILEPRAGEVDGGRADFTRRNGSVGSVRHLNGLLSGAEHIPGHARIVLQVSRWDRLKDMAGVLRGFALHVGKLPDDVHLLLAGPDVSGVSDDPEGAATYGACVGLWLDLPAATRERVHLCGLPMDDPEENAHLVNALQSRASVVVQKSLAEGFGLTVTEPMWKARPVVASAVGGILDQIEDGVSGLLLPDPTDAAVFIETVRRLIDDPELAGSIGSSAKERVRDHFLGDGHLIAYVGLFETLLARSSS